MSIYQEIRQRVQDEPVAGLVEADGFFIAVAL